jgi:putative hemolysin
MTLASSVDAPPTRARRDHIVDVLIAERAPGLSASPAWPVLRPLLYAMLGYARARALAEAIRPLPGRAALDLISRALDLRLDIRGLERVPREGRLIVVANHPTGLADGLAVYDALKGVRPDLCFYANADAHRVAERCLAIFPAGRLARRKPGGGLSDPPWAASAPALARKHRAQILPVHLSGPYSTLFHLFDRFSGELRDITLFHEMLNKRGRRFTLTFGRPIPPEALSADSAEAAQRLKAHVEAVVPIDPDRAFA